MRKSILILLFVILISGLGRSAHAQALVIANPSVNASDITKNELRNVFLGSTPVLKNGTHVLPILLKAGPVHEEFLSAYIGKNDMAFKAGWRSLVFSGQSIMPKTFDSEASLIDYVAHTRGAIGYIGKSTPHDGVKVLVVR